MIATHSTLTINVQNERATEISVAVVMRVLQLYPEEHLEERQVFREALSAGSISFADLKEESARILVPWQLFFLGEGELTKHISHIEKQRKHKVSSRLMAKRRGTGSVTSKRIIDRLIRQQNYLIESTSAPLNRFCGKLKGKPVTTAANELVNFFGFDKEKLWSFKSKDRALEYIIDLIEDGRINVSRGVLTNGILPYLESSRNVYRNTSGFVIRDERIPFIFLPSEINPDEAASRQLYTLIYLLVVIGMDQYQYCLDSNFSSRTTGLSRMEKRIHAITAEVLMPTSETEKLKSVTLDKDSRDEWATRLKISPTALITILWIRKIITEEGYNELLPEPFDSSNTVRGRRFSAKVSTSVKKFCGKISHSAISEGVRRGTLAHTQAQYLIFGMVRKRKYREYRSEIGI